MTPDGGYLVACTTGPLNGVGVLAIKTDATGRTVLEKRMPSDTYVAIRDAVPTADGGMLVLVAGGGAALLKLDQDGRVDWQQTYDGISGPYLALAQTPDGGFALVGGTKPDIGQTQPFRLIKTDAFGNVQWDALTEESPRQIWALGVTRGGEVLMAGTIRTEDTQSLDIDLLKTDLHGVVQWERTYGGSDAEVALQIAVLDDGAALAGELHGTGSFVMRTAADGDELWLNTYPVDFIGDIMPSHDDGIVIVGAAGRPAADAFLARIDLRGRLEWTRRFGRSGAGSDYSVAVAPAASGYILTGQSRESGEFDDDVLLVRTDASGRAPAMQDGAPCPDPAPPLPPPALPDPVQRDWRLDRGPVNDGSLRGFSERPNGDVLAVYARHVYQFSGDRWQILDAQAPNLLYDIAAVEADYFVAAGINHTIFHFDGGTWKIYVSPAPHYSYSGLIAVWGSSRSDVFAVGAGTAQDNRERGAIVHFDGTAWAQMNSGTAGTLFDVWGLAPNDVWAVGRSGIILHYDGSAWTESHTGGGMLGGVWGAASNDVYAVGAGGNLLHFDGTGWSSTSLTTLDLAHVSGRGANDVYVVGGTNESQGVMLHFDGNSWSDLSDQITGGTPPRLDDVLAASAGRVFVSRGDLDIRTHWFDGAAWHASDPEQPTLRAVWAYSSNFAVAAGDKGDVLRWNGTQWGEMASGTGAELHAVVGFAPDDVFIGARDGSIRHFDGVSWKEMDSPASYVNDMWGSAPDDVYAAGAQLVHYDGQRWMDVTPKGSNGMWGIWGLRADDVYAIYDSDVWHFDGCEWSKVHTGTEGFRSVWCQPGPLVCAVGDRGSVARYDDGTWTLLDTGTREFFTSVWGRGANDIFAAGNSIFAGYYVLLHYDGHSWTTPPRVSSFALNDVYGTSDGTVFAVGNGGVIVHAAPK